MSEERYAILFSSVTGNTKELADVIRETLPEEKCDFFGGVENQEPIADMLYIGFWTDKGNADQAAIQLLQKLKKQKRSFCSELPVSAAAKRILEKFWSASGSRWTQAIRLSGNTCVRAECRRP